MKLTCDIVLDLLPLYHDDVVNDSTKKAVAEHLQQCEGCRTALEKIKVNPVDNYLKNERTSVVQAHQHAVKRKSFIAGISIASVLAIPVLVTLIVNLSVGRTLDWFFIVLTSLMLVASISVVPLVVEKEKLLWTMGSFTGTLTLLLASVAIFDRGDWFFVAITPVIFGLSILFAPYVVHKLPLKGTVANHKGLLVMATNTALLYAVIFVSVAYTGTALADVWRSVFIVPPVSLILPWGMFLIIRYLRVNGLLKAGLCVLLTGVYATVLGDVLNWVIDGVRASFFEFTFTHANLFDWSNASMTVTNANIHLLILLNALVVGGALTVAGLLLKKRK